MTVTVSPELQFRTAFSPRGLRDPLGVCGLAFSVAGDATAGTVIINADIPALDAERYVFMFMAMAATVANSDPGNLDLVVNARSPTLQVEGQGDTVFRTGSDFIAVDGRFNAIDPWPRQLRDLVFWSDRGDVPYAPVQLRFQTNVNLAVYTIDLMGYYWDKQVLRTPGPLLPWK